MLQLYFILKALTKIACEGTAEDWFVCILREKNKRMVSSKDSREYTSVLLKTSHDYSLRDIGLQHAKPWSSKFQRQVIFSTPVFSKFVAKVGLRMHGNKFCFAVNSLQSKHQ